jgi:acetyl/propionyl-CoA carboxylase alpha subunit
VVEAAAELEGALEAAAREAQAAFGDGRVFIEKYLARPRHIEVQVIGDHHGEIIALGERECSIQRRHQKIIEESPAPGIAEGLRERMIEAALRLVRRAGYRNAGTVEFLVDGGDFYFLEVNARLQVEHPVTEMRFGQDLVREQIRVAMGERISAPATPRGWAIECRINAEDAAHDFRPATGTVIQIALPGGPGVRVDTHLARGAEISPYYDSLVAKLICWGEDREQARRRMVGAFDEFALLGVHTTAAFLREIVRSEPFARAELSTRFIPEFFARAELTAKNGAENINAALIAAALVSDGAIGIATRSGGINAAVDGVAEAHAAADSPWARLGAFELWGRR